MASDIVPVDNAVTGHASGASTDALEPKLEDSLKDIAFGSVRSRRVFSCAIERV